MNTAIHWVMKIVWFIAIIVLLATGLATLGIWNLFEMDFMVNNPWLVTTIGIIAGIAGVLGLIRFVSCMSGSGSSWCGCGSSNYHHGNMNMNGMKKCPACGMTNCHCR